ncbi:uncharacterized protein LOC141663785 [Apium graveolens]|uniref:uncharacterized protein LOC141663785 n=1 Tax=Apium graveolens TaxID=4045 RepID=UPI003D7A07F7
MVGNQKFTRDDTRELKAVMFRKIGRRRADKYFNLLNKFLSLKVGKYEFDKLCVRVLGKENLCLHNQLIQTMLKNSSVGTVPPSRVKAHSPISVPFSPRIGRSPANRDRKNLDRPSPLGPLGKSQQSATDLLSLGSRPPIEIASVEDGEEVEQAAESPGIQSRSPFTAPLGILVNKSARKALSGGNQKKFHALTCQQTGELPDAKSLMNHLEHKLEMDGLNISLDCANVMNNGLDSYLKRLIEPCIQLAGSRSMKKCPPQRITGLKGMLPANERFLEKPSNSVNASLLDFRVVLESNPSILGGDWPVLLEKACAHAFEE